MVVASPIIPAPVSAAFVLFTTFPKGNVQGPTVPTPVGATRRHPLGNRAPANRPHARGRNALRRLQAQARQPTVPTPVGATPSGRGIRPQAANRPHARGRNWSRTSTHTISIQPSPRPWAQRRAGRQRQARIPTVPTPVGATNAPRRPRRRCSQPSPRPWAQPGPARRRLMVRPTVPTPVGATLNGRSTVSPIVRGDGACREDRQPQPTTLLRTSLGLVSRRRSTCRRQSRPLHARLDSRRFSTRVAAGLSPHSGHGR